ncbi:hypothetical protein MKEN_00175000 [Mycena kentingensis (nom. inval.)]|nr:hypothetical protein MKEN_00175000 [Mycena kentingensis (nom. inval.)]
MGAAADIPQDVWSLIAQYLPRDRQLYALISLNRAFYNIILDDRYRVLRWDKLDHEMVKSLARLRTPSIARRVRRLHVFAWFIHYLARKAEAPRPPPLPRMFSAQQFIVKHIRLAFALGSSPLHGGPPVPKDVLASMTDAVRLMTNVTEYTFEWRDLPATPPTQNFLLAARAAFGVSLRKLTLNAQLDKFSSLLSTVDFDNLEDLALFFDHDNAPPGPNERTASLLCDSLVPFISHFRRSLNALAISSASKADLSPLFHALASETIPHLHRLSISLAFDAATLSDPTGIIRILQVNAESLDRVEISRAAVNMHPARGDPPKASSTWVLFSAALHQPAVLSGLETLKLSVLASPSDTIYTEEAVAFPASLACIRRSADTLTNLALANHFLTEKEFRSLLDVFAHRPLDRGLRALHIGLQFLSIEVFDLLSQRASGLRLLYLVLPRTVVLATAHTFQSSDRGQDREFCVQLHSRKYTDWPLEDIGIWERRFVETHVAAPFNEEVELMKHIAARIPSVRLMRGVEIVAKAQPVCSRWKQLDAGSG